MQIFTVFKNQSEWDALAFGHGNYINSVQKQAICTALRFYYEYVHSQIFNSCLTITIVKFGYYVSRDGCGRQLDLSQDYSIEFSKN